VLEGSTKCQYLKFEQYTTEAVTSSKLSSSMSRIDEPRGETLSVTSKLFVSTFCSELFLVDLCNPLNCVGFFWTLVVPYPCYSGKTQRHSTFILGASLNLVVHNASSLSRLVIQMISLSVSPLKVFPTTMNSPVSGSRAARW